jgi:ATPase subunit of ABC transporter with duplicated ATPase domains
MNQAILDIEMVEYLEGIEQQNITLLVVSHDDTLDNVCNGIWEMDQRVI